MATQVLRRLICVFRKHQWRFEHNRETQGLEADCLRCGAHRSAYPGPLEPNLGGRSAGPDGHGHIGGGDAGGGDGF
ncbi:MAG: hypothetical protein JWN06_3812 [Propionibacteriaceae bacterium]|jgi:hypothetical protein|nr:hypothetical protein [Propionibacteriaceae bacterium]